ncbi:MAG: alpha/beta fold hydrolase [Gammaproteobacteria bacterium]|nr:alpha/beta fold hydrolase [Gammaproteobacteria bacterium]
MELHYDEYGTGDAVLLVHGLGGSSNAWGAQAQALARFFRVIVPDLRGAGRSAARDGINVATMVSDLVELLDRLAIAQAHTIGHSFGSVLAQHLAVNHPTRVGRLGLVGPIRAPSDAAVKALTERAALARREGLVAIANATVSVGTCAQTKAKNPVIAAFVREMVMRQDPQAYAATCEAIAATQGAALESLRCPCLVLTGDEDATSPPAAAHTVANAIEGSTFMIISRCGHWTPIEQPEAVTNHLMNFLFQK